MTTLHLDLPDSIRKLRQRFVDAGFEIWAVGGYPRDIIAGRTPNDIDFATSATPDEQIAIYERHRYSYHPTGLKHGTVTVVLNHTPYEITSLRIDLNHDGRHADVQYTRDIELDLGRRDLTINAIAMTFDGEIIDPFGGVDDIHTGVVRFVGDPLQRMQEDYLRILRYFRFYARFDSFARISNRAEIREASKGLRQISVERIWSEVGKIVSGPMAGQTLALMHLLEVTDAIQLPWGDNSRFDSAYHFTRNPAILMAYYLGDLVHELAVRWKWSNADRKVAAYVVSRMGKPFDLAMAKQDAFSVNRDLIRTVALIEHNESIADAISNWVIPNFPINGNDLIERGLSGASLGNKMKVLRGLWEASDYQMSRSSLLAKV